MNKTKSKVLSLILASAMIVSSFSSLNFASAASTRETGTLKNVAGLNGDDELFLASSDDSSITKIKLADLIGNPSIETYDREDAGTADYDSYNHVSGDKLVTINKDGELTLKKGASGKEVINLTYKVEDYDRDDKEVTVKASKQITVYSNVENEVFLGEANAITGSSKDEKPGDISTAAVNERYLDLEAYYAVSTGSNRVAEYRKADGLTANYLSDVKGTVTKAQTALERVVKSKGTPVAAASATSGTDYRSGAIMPNLADGEDFYVATVKTGSEKYSWTKVTETDTKAVKEELVNNKASKAFTNVVVAKEADTTKTATGEAVAKDAAMPTLTEGNKYFEVTGSVAPYTWTELKSGTDFEAVNKKVAAVALYSTTKTGGTTPSEETATNVAADADLDFATNDYYISSVKSAEYEWNKLTAGTQYKAAQDTKKVNSSLELKGDKIFSEKEVLIAGLDNEEAPGATNVIRLKTKFVKETSSKDADLAKTGTDTLKIKLGTVTADGFDIDKSTSNIKVEVAKKWNADVDLTTGVADVSNDWDIFKKNGKTYIAKKDFDYEDKDTWKDHKDEAESVGSYNEIFSEHNIKVLGGSVDTLKVPGDKTVTVEDGTVGDIKAGAVDISGGTVGTIKDKAENITISDGKVKAIDAKNAVLSITGGSVSGNVVASSIEIDSDDDDVATAINGNVTATGNVKDTSDNDEASIAIDCSSDNSVKVTGTIKNEAAKGTIEISGENVALGVVDGDYASSITFKDFTGTIKGIAGASEQTVSLEGESKFALTNKLVADTVDIEEDSRLQVTEARIGSIEGEGRFAFPADKLFVEDGIDGDTTLEITDGLVAGATALQAFEGAVAGSDVTGLGFDLETKSANKTTDKLIIKNVRFAGPKFDKTDLTIAKGQSTTVAISNYPNGTALPAGTSIAYDVDVNDDYVSVTQEGNVLTIKALDFNADRTVDNKGTITASVVDADGNVLEDYSEATLNVNVIAKPQSAVTLDTTKPVAIGTGAVYQYIAKSSTSAVMTAASSDTQVATVELFNAADARGYKFQIKALAVGTATITTTDANGASATLTVNVSKVNGTLKADTTSYTFAPGKAYDVKFSTTGTTAVPVVTVNGKVVSIAPRGNGVYRVTAQNPGTAYVVAKVGDTRVSVKFVVANGAASAGVKGNNVSNLK
ncbi:MAG: hypothetical protein E7L17_10605 [Clostridium sp.]|uniref:hypothetical protein n=1 Tax=Clostridium sp. TaxID=1506 RepID=UPI00290D5994|nr:hypothetical protein [Clostridium sp.]MDU7338550.1 hypothetical protein [Clostridium sp.]